MASKMLAAAYFTWKWVWSTTDHHDHQSIMIQGHMKFIKEADCRKAGMRCQPVYDTWDGPDSRVARLIVTAYDDKDRAIPVKEVRGTFDLWGDVRIQALVYDGQPRIDIRRWSCGYPTKQGLSLSPQDWLRLIDSKNNLTALTKDVKEGRQVDERLHINGSVFASV